MLQRTRIRVALHSAVAALAVMAGLAFAGPARAAVLPPAGIYQLLNLGTSAPRMCLDADANHLGNGDKVQVWGCSSSGAQQQVWTWEGPTGSLAFQFRLNTSQGTFCLDEDATHSGDGNKVQLWQCNGSVQQRWSFNANWSIQNHRDGRCLDADANQLGNNGAKVTVWHCSFALNQSWADSSIM